MKKVIIFTGFGSFLFGCIVVFLFHYYLLKEPQHTKITETIYNSNFEIGIVKEDLATYGRSSIFIKIVTPAIENAAEKYKIPIGLLHAIFRVESDYRPQIDHNKVTVPVHGNNIITNAIGMGGVLWVYWGDSLKARGIAETEMDLYFPQIAIEATAYILKQMIDAETKVNGNLNSFNVLSNIIKRYFGAYSLMYLAKMEKYTSDLWMKRIAKEVLDLTKQKYKE